MDTRQSLFEPKLVNQKWTKDQLPDQTAFLSWPEQDKLIDVVRDTIDNTGKMVLLSGPQGVGKTTLVYRIQSQLPGNWLLCRVNANPMLNTDQLLQRVVRFIGEQENASTPDKPPIQHENKSGVGDIERSEESEPKISIPLGGIALTNNLYADCRSLRARGVIPVIIVDDADQLPHGTLKSLLRLHSRTESGLPPFGLILLTEPLLKNQLADLMRENTRNATEYVDFQSVDMPVLTLEQMPAYFLHFFTSEDIRADHELFEDKLEIIHKEAYGLPGKINELIMRSLREDTVGAFELAQRPTLNKMTLLLVGVLSIGAIGFAAVQFPITNNLLKQFFDEELGDVAALPNWLSQSLSVFKSSPEEISMPDTDNSKPGADVKTHQGSKFASPSTAQPILQSDQLAVSVTSISKETAPKDSVITTLVEPPEKSPIMGSKEWLQQQPAKAYTIQLFVAADELGAQRYISRNKILNNTFYAEGKQGNSYVYYVFQGIYPTRTEANAALKVLPASLHKNKPWLRSLSGIQSSVRK